MCFWYKKYLEFSISKWLLVTNLSLNCKYDILCILMTAICQEKKVVERRAIIYGQLLCPQTIFFNFQILQLKQ